MANESILIVEDEGIIAQDIQQKLKGLGYNVPAIANSGEEAIRMAEEYNPDLVLMDIRLKGSMDGIEAATRTCLRHNIPIVYLTGYADKETLDRAKITEPIGYILKPYDKKELHANIEMALYQYKVGRRRRELRFRGILEASPDAILVTDINGRIMLVNNQTEKMFGYKRDELIGGSIDLLVPERLRATHPGHREAYYSAPKTRPMGFGRELCGLCKDGREFPVEISLSPVETEEGFIVISIVSDITERKRAERRLLAQYAITMVLAEAVTLSAATPKIIQAICESTGWDLGTIWTVDRETRDLRCIEHWHHPSVDFKEFEEVTRGSSFSSGVGLPGRVWASGRPIWISDIARDADFPRAPYAARAGLHGAFGFPIMIRSEVLGVIDFQSREIRQPDEDLINMFTSIGGQIGQFVERKQQEKMVQRLAYYDVITGLPNRIMFHDRLQQVLYDAGSENIPLALLIISLNRFDEINNTLGNQYGDIVLQQLGRRLSDIIGKDYMIARIGEDEFGILMLDTDADSATQSADKIIKRLGEPVTIEGFSIDISIAIGIVLFPGHSEDAGTLIRRGYIAVETAKKNESGHNIYSSQYDQFVPERLALMGDLRRAIEQNHLFLAYQPTLDLKSGRTVTIEALVRWRHAVSGIIFPDKFISLAEQTGLIKPLTTWVLNLKAH